MSEKKPVAAAVATLVFDEKRLLLGRRVRQQVFEGWQCPGGYLSEGQSIEQAARNYCLEKAGVEIMDMEPGPYTNNIFSDTPLVRHTVSLYQVARLHRVLNIEKFENREMQWRWFDLQALPSAQFLPLKLLLEQYDLRQFAGI
ncbi:MAG TPA: NUDIX domain-containing protein [Gammaproteobacteria bacterium]|nr:NUDIX domain-containing protein [Gammaproteobacteria bacterium]